MTETRTRPPADLVKVAVSARQADRERTMRHMILRWTTPSGGTPSQDFYLYRADGTIVLWSRTGEVTTHRLPTKERD